MSSSVSKRERERLDALRNRAAYLERKASEISAEPLNHHRRHELSATKWAVEVIERVMARKPGVPVGFILDSLGTDPVPAPRCPRCCRELATNETKWNPSSPLGETLCWRTVIFLRWPVEDCETFAIHGKPRHPGIPEGPTPETKGTP